MFQNLVNLEEEPQIPEDQSAQNGIVGELLKPGEGPAVPLQTAFHILPTAGAEFAPEQRGAEFFDRGPAPLRKRPDQGAGEIVADIAAQPIPEGVEAGR